MTIPSNYIHAENSAAAMLRGQNWAPVSPQELFAVAQVTMSAYQASGADGWGTQLHTEDSAKPLFAAARTLDALAHSQKARGLPSGTVARTRVLAAVAFAMAGNFPSANAVLREVELVVGECTSVELCAIGLSCPQRVPLLLSRTDLGPLARKTLEALNYLLGTADQTTETALWGLISEIGSEAQSPFDWSVIGSMPLMLGQVISLSIGRNLRGESQYVRQFGRNLSDAGRPCFLPPQAEVVNNAGYRDVTKNAILTVPTSGGKTLLAEYAIAKALEGGPGLAIYVAPYNALGSQVAETLQSHFKGLARVHSAFGGFKRATSLHPESQREILVATPERLDATLRSLNLYDHLRVIVFDEAHIIENGARGARIEALIARMRMQQVKGKALRIILLSAVLSDVTALCSWLGQGTVHVSNGWRPTTRRVAIWESTGVLTWIYGSDLLRPDARQPEEALVQAVLPWPQRMYATDKIPQIMSQMDSAYANVSYLARYMVRLLGGPILLVCGTKAKTRELAAELAKDLPVIDVQPPVIQDLVQLIESSFPHLRPLAKMAARGVCYHNAALPAAIREKLELGIKTRALTFTCATTTLAEGVDLPFRTTILFDWLTGFKETEAPMPSLLFRNIAGRCGRAGEFVEGDTVIFDNMLGSLRYTHEANRRSYQSQVLGVPPTLKSLIANDNASPADRHSVNAVMSSQLMAAVPEHPTEDRVDLFFADHLYAAHIGQPTHQLLAGAREQLLDASFGEPFAKAASPMWLTETGIAANQTGLSVDTVRRIEGFLSELTPTTVDQLATSMVEAFGAVPEQSNPLIAKVASGAARGSFITLGDIEAMSSGWRANTPLQELFTALPKAVKSKAAVTPLVWATGEHENKFVASQHDKFVEVVEYLFGFFLPWFLRCCSQMASVSTNPVAKSISWTEIADEFENARAFDAAAMDAGIESGESEG